MNKRKKNGFTLVELICVIVLLSFVALIAIPTIINIINEGTKRSFINSATGIIRAGNLHYSKKYMLGESLEEVTFNFPNEIGELKINGSIPERGMMKISSKGDIGIAISNGKYCITKGYYDANIEVTENVENCIIPVRITNLVLSNQSFSMEVGEEKK